MRDARRAGRFFRTSNPGPRTDHSLPHEGRICNRSVFVRGLEAVSKRPSATFFMLAIATLSAGCAAPERYVRPSFGNARHLVFNPEATGYVMADVSRAPWPTTSAEPDPNVEVTFRETIRDEQGRFSFQGNDYTRSVRSTRRGRGRR